MAGRDRPGRDVLARARCPYGWALLNARPTLASVKDLRGIRGAPPDSTEVATGCPFVDRCTQAVAECHDHRPPLVAPDGEGGARPVACVRRGLVPVLSARGLRKTYKVAGSPLRPERVAAVDGVDVEVREGEVVGLVGATGAGKSTLGMMLVRLLDPDGGTVTFEGRDLLAAHDGDLTTVLRVADRVVVLDRGRVVEEGTGSELLLRARHPVTRALLEAAGRDPVLGAPAGGGPDGIEDTAPAAAGDHDNTGRWERPRLVRHDVDDRRDGGGDVFVLRSDPAVGVEINASRTTAPAQQCPPPAIDQ